MNLFALTNILIELRLRRGLSVILGDVGTGKTTLSRKLIQELKDRDDFVFQIMLDPSFENDNLFLTALAKNFDINSPFQETDGVPPTPYLRAAIERFLFQKGVTENKVVVLIIDESQKLSDTSLEVLRVLLNYETNEFKLLQLVLLGQMELHAKIIEIANFFDRISFKYTLNPLGMKETREMIDFRVRQAGYRASMNLFLDDAIEEIHRHSKGYPRRITMLCHKALKNMVLKNKFVVDGALVDNIVEEEIRSGWHRSEPLLQKNNC